MLKAKDGQVRFGFLTGVSKIGRMSVFSGLNNLNDISMDCDYTEICGITEKELHEYFDSSVVELAESNGLSKSECYARLEKMYDGYHFARKSTGMYNPFSLLLALSKREFGEYWFNTGTPTILVDVMKNTTFDVSEIEDQEVDSSGLNGVDSIIDNPVPLFFQTGYLTIKDYDPEYGLYKLGFPNDEVRSAFMKFLLRYFLPEYRKKNMLLRDLSVSLNAGDPERFMTALDSLFSGMSYQIQETAEKNFQYAMFLIAKLMGYMVEVEYATSNGRMDMLVKTKSYIYVIELKIDSSAEAAMRQIEEKGYARPFVSDSRKLYKIGVNFSTSDRRIDGWKIE